MKTMFSKISTNFSFNLHNLSNIKLIPMTFSKFNSTNFKKFSDMAQKVNAQETNKQINFIKNDKNRNISEYYSIFNKLAEKKNLDKERILENGLNLKIPKIIAKPNKSKKFFQDLQNKGLFLKMKGENDYFNTSAKKLKLALAKIRGKYIHDALEILKNDHTKSSKKLQTKLQEFFKGNRCLNSNKYVLKIKVATAGNRNGIRRINYRAKGRINFWQRKQSMANIGFDKVPLKTLAEEIASGRTPLFVRNKIKQNIFKSNLDYSDVKKLRFMLSSNGIRERRVMINSSIRKIVDLYKIESKKKINNKIVRESIIKSLTPSCLALLKKYLFLNPFQNKVKFSKDKGISIEDKVNERKEKMENFVFQ